MLILGSPIFVPGLPLVSDASRRRPLGASEL
jgi:hypothetical protein